jgi:hypothetical protein
LILRAICHWLANGVGYKAKYKESWGCWSQPNHFLRKNEVSYEVHFAIDDDACSLRARDDNGRSAVDGTR